MEPLSQGASLPGIQDYVAKMEGARGLERVRHLHEAGLAGRLVAIGRDTAPRLKDPFRSADHGDLLYDERGLPA